MTGIDFTRVVVKRLSESTPGIGAFKNRIESMAVHLQTEALEDQKQKRGTTWVWVYDDSVTLGYVTLSMYSIDRKDILKSQDAVGQFPYRSIPALLIGQLATNEEYERNGIGSSMAWWSIGMALNLSETVGCRLVALHPHKDVIDWYKNLEFKIINKEDRQDIMYLDILKRSGG